MKGLVQSQGPEQRGSKRSAPSSPAHAQMGPAAIRYLQHAAGNSAVSFLLQRAPVAPGVDLATPLFDMTGIARLIEKKEKEAEAITSTFAIKDQIHPGESLEFMTMMRSYLGPDPATQEHFKSVVKAGSAIPSVYSSTLLHQTTVNRLRHVYDELHGEMPYTDVGQDLRNRYHNRESRSRMAHPMGYAIDFRPLTNPMIKSPVIKKLLELMGGGPSHIEIKDKSGKPMGFDDERAMIEKMGQASSTGATLDEKDQAAADDFFAQMDSEFDRLAKASEKFKTSIKADDLAALKGEYFSSYRPNQAKLAQIGKQLADLLKRGLKTRAELGQKETWEEEQGTLQSAQADFQTRLARVLKPWTDKVAQALADNETKITAAGFVTLTKVPSRKELASMKATWVGFVREQAIKRKQGAKKIKELEAQLAKAQAARKPDKAHIDQLRETLDASRRDALAQAFIQSLDEKEVAGLETIDPLLDERDILSQLQAALSGDMDFIFGPKEKLTGNDERSVINPPMERLAHSGFFTPDAEKGGGPPKTDAEAARRSKSEWFNIAFFKMMARFGFQAGADWHGTADPMHFELVEGVDALLPAVRPPKHNLPGDYPAKGMGSSPA